MQTSANHASLDERDVLCAVLEREKLGSTVIGEGTDSPCHGRWCQRLRFAARDVAEGPVDFDGANVDLVMLVLGCENDRTGHLAAMSAASKGCACHRIPFETPPRKPNSGTRLKI